MSAHSSTSTIRLAESSVRLRGSLAVTSLLSLIVAVGVAISLYWGAVHGWSGFFRSYIVNYAMVVSLALGGLFFVMVQHVTRANWSVVVRRLGELVVATLPWLGLMGLPILIPVWTGDARVYPWSNADEVAQDTLLQAKIAFLNPTFFTIRWLAYFGIWTFLARVFVRSSIDQDRSGSIQLTERMQSMSPLGILLFAFTTTFFSIDLLMSLTPHWYSAIFGVYYFAGCALGFFALLAVMLQLLRSRGLLAGAVTDEHLHDIGKYTLGFTVFWTYIAFSQYMLIWYADLPEETAWYHARQQSVWWIAVAVILLVGHFAIPFFCLLPRPAKRNGVWLACVSILVLLMHWLDMYYLVGPQYHHLHTHASDQELPSVLSVCDVGLLLGLGGSFVWLVARQFEQHALLPIRDPRLAESIVFENV